MLLQEHRPFWNIRDPQTDQVSHNHWVKDKCDWLTLATQRIGRRSKFRDWTDPPVTPREQLESRSNIWPIVLVIYLSMTLKDAQTWVNETDSINEEDFTRLGRHLIGPIQTGRQPEYSQELRDLVYECLNPSVTLRPRPANLVTRTRDGLERFRTTSRLGRDTTKPPALRHLNRSKSVLPAGQAVAVSAGGPAVPGTNTNPQALGAGINRRVKRPPPGDHESPPIIISSGDVLSAELPSEIQNGRESKRSRVVKSEQSVPCMGKVIVNIVGEVIIISNDLSAAAGGSDIRQKSSGGSNNGELRENRSENPSRSRAPSLKPAHQGSRSDGLRESGSQKPSKSRAPSSTSAH